jgi:hypothetical protein
MKKHTHAYTLMVVSLMFSFQYKEVQLIFQVRCYDTRYRSQVNKKEWKKKKQSSICRFNFWYQLLLGMFANPRYISNG